MKIELKHLAPYLPYELRYLFHISEIDNSISVMDGQHINEIINMDYEKPILRPLSDLTKEIEVNGERFVPIYKLLNANTDDLKYKIINGKNSTYGDRIEIWTYPDDNGYENIPSQLVESMYIKSILTASYYRVQKLIEWHFDVFGLIEKGLAVDINTITK